LKNESDKLKFERSPVHLNWNQRFAQDFAAFPVAYRNVRAAALHKPQRLCLSEAAAACLGIRAEDFDRDGERFEACFAQGRIGVGSEDPELIATAYAGHQFGVWAGQLGDGRAMLLGDLPSQASGTDWGFDVATSIKLSDRIEVQLKGSGQTPYSRMGDGRAVLRSSIREFLGSEAMIGLGIPSTRALCLYGSDDPVFRESTETAAVVTRIAPSFLRFGHVEFFAHFQHHDALNHLMLMLAHRHYPQVLESCDRYKGLQSEDQVKVKLLKAIAWQTGDLIARWQSVGFCHGVMNTDNMSLLGLTIDYGPFGFLDQYDEAHVCNHSDYQGRYRYDNQAAVGAWNCRALALAFRSVLSDEAALCMPESLQAYREAFEARWQERFAAKFGLMPTGTHDAQPAWLAEFLTQSMQMLQRCKPDFTLFFRRLSQQPVSPGERPALLRDMMLDPATFDRWWDRYREVAQEQTHSLGWDSAQRRATMLSVNPKYILRNHLAELAIRRARGDHGRADYDEIARLLKVLAKPYDEQPEFDSYAAEPPDWARHLSVSCSS
jgi:uncharacterized protein YdiU (UPF0061 family)